MTTIFQRSRVRRSPAFTLIELLVGVSVLSLLMLITLSSLDNMRQSWKSTRVRVEQFRGARVAFETMSRNLSQATLNTYWDYYYADTKSNVPAVNDPEPPAGYVRQSELHFWTGAAREALSATATQNINPGHAIFFQAPLGQSDQYRGLASLLNARGYYIQFGSDEDRRPSFMPSNIVRVRHRYRLMEYRPPAEGVAGGTPGNAVYSKPDTWYREGLVSNSRIVADNIVLLVIMPLVPEETISTPGQKPWWLAPAYRYNSKDTNNSTPVVDPIRLDVLNSIRQGTQHLLPPQLRLTMVALDEESAARWMLTTDDEPVDLQEEAKAAFLDPALYDQDLQRVKSYLEERKLNHRVFSQVITLRNALWDSQTY